MAYRSWLKDVRKVQDLGPHLNTLTFRKPEDCERDAQYMKLWDELRRRPIPVAEEYLPFFGSRMHDSWVLAVSREGRQFRVVLNCIDAVDFAREVRHRLGLESDDAVFPVELVCHDIAYVNAVRAAPGGSLRWVDWERLSETTERKHAGEFLYDWFFEQDGRLQWIAHLYRNERGAEFRHSEVYLLIDCVRVSVVDRRRDTIVSRFGARAGEWWDRVRQESQRRNLSSGYALRDFIAQLDIP